MSICVSLLELSPMSSGKEDASTCSELGGARLGVCFGVFWAELEGCDLAESEGDEFCAMAGVRASRRTVKTVRMPLCYPSSEKSI